MKEKQWKICQNPDCKEVFYRADGQNIHQWRLVKFHDRMCQLKFRDRDRKPAKYRHKNAYNLQELNDSLNRYSKLARKKMREELTVYSSKTMTQEELQALVPSMGVGT